MIELPSPLAPLGGHIVERIVAATDLQDARQLLWSERLYGLLTADAFHGLSDTDRGTLALELQQLRTRFEVRQEVRERDLYSAIRALHERGVNPVILKGAALGPRFYPSAASRPSVDVDLLISAQDISAVHDVFQTLGWKLASGVRGRWISSQWSYRTARSDALSTSLDIHWRLSNRPQLHYALAYKEILEQAHAPTKTFPFAHTISSTHALVHAVIHLIGHHRDEHIPALWYVDIATLERALTPEERARAIHILRARGLLALAAKTWQDAAKDIGFQPSEETAFLLKASARREDGWKVAPSTRVGEVLADLSALSGYQRIGYLRELLFPPEESLRAAYGDTDRDTALWRLYLRRLWARGVRRKNEGR